MPDVRELAISGLKLPGDMQERMSSPRARSRAASISEHGLIHYPIVRREGWELVAGADRIAACMLLGWENVTCDIRDMTAEEAEVIRQAENAERRHDAEEARLASLGLKRALEVKLMASGMPSAGPGRRKTASAEARRIVAEETGVKEETLRKREQRQRAKEEKRESKPESPINTIGLELSDEFLGQVNVVRSYIKELTSVLGRAKTILSQLEEAGVPNHQSRLLKLSAALVELTSGVKGYLPVALCPYCKGTEGIQENCGLCESSGWIQKCQEPEVALRFWSTENPIVMDNGEEKPLNTDEDPFV